MSNGLNRVTLLGNLGDDPELKFGQKGGGVLKFTVACNTGYTDKDGEWKDITDWVRCVVFGKRAEALGKLLNKGSKVYVEGRFSTSTYEDKDSGEKRYSTEVVVSELILCDGKGGGKRERDDDDRDRRPAPRGREDDRRREPPARERDDRSRGRGRDDDRRAAPSRGRDDDRRREPPPRARADDDGQGNEADNDDIPF